MLPSRATVRVAPVALLCAAILIGHPRSARVSALALQAVPPGHLLDDYAHGDFVGPIRLVAASESDFAEFRRRFETEADVWVRASDPETTARRRLAAATFVLEVVHTASTGAPPLRVVSAAQRPSAEGRREAWIERLRLIEWACRLLREERIPSTGERLWHLASLQLAHDPIFLFGLERMSSDSRTRNVYQEYGNAMNHLKHAESRFPDEPSVRLLKIEHQTDAPDCSSIGYQIWSRVEVSQKQIAAWQQQAASLRAAREAVRWIQDQVFMTVVNDPTKSADYVRCANARRTIQRNLKAWQAPASIEDAVQFELGALAMLFGERPAAIEHFRVAADSNDIYYRYLARLLTGRTHQIEGNLSAAASDYRSALSVLPDTPSASMALATVLFLQGQSEEADQWAADALRRLDAHDPWIDFVNGQHDRWPALIGPLRASFVQ
jgi:tetratricopeptide (TPR) repeat protein